MKVYDALPGKCPVSRSVVALGMFDGLHRGHAAVLKALCSAADAEPGAAACVFTFSTERGMPDSKTAGRLLSRGARDGLLEAMGVDCVFQPEFEDFRNMPPEAFVEDFILRYFGASAVFCGEDFHFGKDAAASAKDLKRLLPDGVRAHIIPTLRVGGEPVSATRIRALIRKGDVRSAAGLLGRVFTLDFPVERGRQLGRRLDAPTINQAFPEGFVIPRFGVYASISSVVGRRLPSVTNVGVKPTVGSSRVLAETHIRGFSGDLYGQAVPVELVEFIRDEQKFQDISSLKRQIEKDAEQAARITGG